MVGSLCIFEGVLTGSQQEREPPGADHPSPGLLPLLTSPRVLLPLVTVSVAAITVGWLESLLSLFLTSTFSLSLSAVGLCFLLWSVFYTAGDPHDSYAIMTLTFSLLSLLCDWLGV